MFDVLFGVDANAFDPNSEFVVQASNQMTSSPYAELWNLIYAVFPFVRNICPPTAIPPQFVKWFKGLFTHVMEMRRSQSIVRDDYMNFLIELKNRKNIPDDELHSHAYTFFFDATTTTSQILYVALNTISTYTECQDRLRAEVKSCPQPSFDKLNDLPFLDSFLNGEHNFFLPLNGKTKVQ